MTAAVTDSWAMEDAMIADADRKRQRKDAAHAALNEYVKWNELLDPNAGTLARLLWLLWDEHRDVLAQIIAEVFCESADDLAEQYEAGQLADLVRRMRQREDGAR
jgi:hypothetical protein